jgi:hypothetical protein
MQKISKKDKIWKIFHKKINLLKKIHPKYYAIVIGLVIIAILVKKYRSRIGFILKTVLNV